MANNAEIVVDLRGRDHLTPAIKSAESSIIRFVGAVSAAFAAVSTVAFPIAAAAEFQKQLIEVRKTTDFSTDAILSLGDGLINLSKNINVSAADLAKIAAVGGQLGVGEKGGAAGLLAFTEEIARAATALDVDAERAATAMGKLVNIFNIPTEQFRNAIAVVNQMANVSTATADELFDIMRRIGDLGGSVNVAQSAALAAFATDIGFTAETAGTTLVKIFADMKSKAAEFAEFMGMSVTDWVTIVDRDGVDAFTRYIDKLNELPTEIAAATKETLTGGGRIFSFVSKAQDQAAQGGALLSRLMREAAAEFETGNSAIREQENVLSGVSAQWQVLKNKATAVFLESGDKTLQPLTRMLVALGDLVSNEGFTSGMERLMSLFGAVFDFGAKVFSSLSTNAAAIGSAFEVATVFAFLKGLQAIAAAYSAVQAAAARSLGFVGAGAAGAGAAGAAAEQAKVTGLAKLYQELAASRVAAAQAAAAAEAAATNASTAAYEKQRAAMAASGAAVAARGEIAQAVLAAEAAAIQRNTALAAAQAAATRLRQVQALSPTAVADDYLAQKTAEQQARVQSLTVAHNARIAAAKAAGAAEQVAILEAQFAKELAAESARQARQKGGIASHYNALRAQAVAHHQDMIDIARAAALTTAREALAAQKAQIAAIEAVAAARNAAATKVSSARGASTDAAINSLNADAAADAARRAADATRFSWSKVSGVIVSALAPVTAFTREMIAAQGAVQKFGVLAVGAFTAARTAMSALAAVVMRFFMIWLVVDIAKMLLEWLGLWEGLAGKINSVIEKINSSTGLKLPKLRTAEAEQSAKDAAEKMEKEIQRIAASAELFSKKFGGTVTLDVDTESGDRLFEQSMQRRKQSFDELAAAVKKGITFDLDNANRSAAVLSTLAEYVSLAGVEVENLEAKMNGYGAAVDASRTKQQALLNEMLTASGRVGANTKGSDAYNDILAIQERLNAEMLNEVNLLQRIGRGREAVETLQRQQLDAQTELIRALPKEYKFEVIDSGLLASYEKQKKAVEDLTAERKKLSVLGSSTGANDKEKSDLAAVSALLRDAEDAQSQYADAIVNAQSVASVSLGRSKDQILAFVTGMGTAQQQAANITTAVAANLGNIESAMQGKAAIPVTIAKNYHDALRRYLYVDQFRKVYEQAATSAAASAKRAKDAVALVAQEIQRTMDATQQAIKKAYDAISEGPKQAKQNIFDRKVDAQLKQELTYLDARKQKELELARTLEQRIAIEAKYDARALELQDQAEVLKAQNAVERYGNTVSETVAEFAKLQQKSALLTKDISNTKLSPEVRVDLIRENNKALADMEVLLEKAKGGMDELGKVGNTAFGGKTLDVKVNVDQASSQVNKLAESFGVARKAAAEATAGATASYAQLMQSGAQAAKALETSLYNKLIEMGKQSARQTGQIFDEAKLTKQLAGLASSPSFAKLRKELADLYTRFAETGSGISFDPKAFNKLVEDAVKKVDLDGVKITPDMDVNVDNVSSDVLAAVQEGLNVASGKVAPANVPIQAEADARQISDALNAGGPYTVRVRASDQSGGASDKFADGGPILGAGTSRSDSIPIWASHGEYMMDGLSVRMFGTAFFRRLQAIAKSGQVGAVRNLLPRGFADGGPILKMPSFSFPEFPVLAGASGGGDSTVKLDLSLNGKQRATVHGSREQISGLVDALRDIKRGL